MYEDYYNLNGRPFQLTPDPKYYFRSESHGPVLDYLAGEAREPEGFVLVSGKIGTGKTTLARHLLDALDKSHYVGGMMSNTRVEGEDLLVTILTAFELDARAESVEALLETLQEFLMVLQARGRTPVLIVDEAQNLSTTALEELRGTLGIGGESVPLMHCILVGQPSLHEKIFSEQALKPFAESISLTCELEALSPEEAAGYLLHRLKMVGWDNSPTFTDEAMEALHEHSKGVPRQLNTLCARVLLFGALEELQEIDLDAVESVAADMAEETQLNASHRERISSLANSGVSAASMGGANDKTIPLELAGRTMHEAQAPAPAPAAEADDDLEEVEGRINKLEGMMKSQSDTLQQLTSLMTQLTQKK